MPKKQPADIDQNDDLKKEILPADDAAQVDDLVNVPQEDFFEPADDDLAQEEEQWNEEESLANVNSYIDDISDDSVRMYLREIGKIPLLNTEEELDLAYKIVANSEELQEVQAEIADVKKEAEALRKDGESVPKELVDKQRSLEDKAARLSEPKDKMAEANMRLVVSIAKRYSGRGLDFLDLIQEGNTGLLRAVEKFDPDLGFKFSTYATWWIRQAITRAIADQARTIRIPVHMVETINKLLRTQRRLTQELNREPTNEEIAQAMEMEVDKVEYVMKIKQDITSLDASVGNDDEDSVLGDFIEDEGAPSPVDAANAQLLKSTLWSILNDFSERERKILVLRHGLEGGRPRTLEEVGRIFGVTRERIRQIEAKLFAKIRKHPKGAILMDYLPDAPVRTGTVNQPKRG